MRLQRKPELMANGLPQWAVSVLDGAISAKTVNWGDLDGLTTDELLALAREIVARQLKGVDVPDLIEQVRQ